MSTESRETYFEHGQTCTRRFPRAPLRAPERESSGEFPAKVLANSPLGLYQNVKGVTLSGELAAGVSANDEFYERRIR